MAAKGSVLGGGLYRTERGSHFVLSLIDLDEPGTAPSLLDLSFLVHSVVFDPNNPTRAAVFEKMGPGASVVDLKTLRELKKITTLQSRHFYGHGAYSKDGALLYATESILTKNHKGLLVVRDAKTLQELGSMPTHGTSPHDCVLIDDGKTMVVANGGGNETGSSPSVTYVDVAAGKLLDRVSLREKQLNAGHISVVEHQHLVCVSAPRLGLADPEKRLGGVSLRRQQTLVRLEPPTPYASRMLGETLSVLIDTNHNRIYATQPLGHMITLWKLDTGEFEGTIEVQNPRGITLSLDHDWLVVGHSTPTGSVRLSAFDATTTKPVATFVDPSFITGSHIFRCKLTA